MTKKTTITKHFTYVKAGPACKNGTVSHRHFNLCAFFPLSASSRHLLSGWITLRHQPEPLHSTLPLPPPPPFTHRLAPILPASHLKCNRSVGAEVNKSIRRGAAVKEDINKEEERRMGRSRCLGLDWVTGRAPQTPFKSSGVPAFPALTQWAAAADAAPSSSFALYSWWVDSLLRFLSLTKEKNSERNFTQKRNGN